MVVAGKNIDNKKLIIGVVIAAAAGVGVWLIIRAIKKRSINNVFGNTSRIDAVQTLTEFNNLSSEIEAQATISRDKAATLAAQIKNAWGVNDDEAAVFAALQQINNYSDWLLLQTEYGVNSSFLGDRDLEADLVYHLNDNELKTVYRLLDNKGISLKFMK